jgi:hypothetical protein
MDPSQDNSGAYRTHSAVLCIGLLLFRRKKKKENPLSSRLEWHPTEAALGLLGLLCTKTS